MSRDGLLIHGRPRVGRQGSRPWVVRMVSAHQPRGSVIKKLLGEGTPQACGAGHGSGDGRTERVAAVDGDDGGAQVHLRAVVSLGHVSICPHRGGTTGLEGGEDGTFGDDGRTGGWIVEWCEDVADVRT